MVSKKKYVNISHKHILQKQLYFMQNIVKSLCSKTRHMLLQTYQMLIHNWR